MPLIFLTPAIKWIVNHFFNFVDGVVEGGVRNPLRVQYRGGSYSGVHYLSPHSSEVTWGRVCQEDQLFFHPVLSIFVLGSLLSCLINVIVSLQLTGWHLINVLGIQCKLIAK